MSGREEFSTNRRGWAPYPAAWGPPEGEPMSEARTLWVLKNIGEQRTLNQAGTSTRSGTGARTTTGRSQHVSNAGRSAYDALARVRLAELQVPTRRR